MTKLLMLWDSTWKSHKRNSWCYEIKRDKKEKMDLQLRRTLVLMTSDPKVEVFLNKDIFK